MEPPPEEDDDFSPPLARPPKPVYSSKYEGGKYMSGVEAFLGEDGSGFKYRNIRKELSSLRQNLICFLINLF